MTSPVSNSMGVGIRPLPLSLLTPIGMGALRKFSRAVQNPQHLKKLTVFSVRRSRKRKCFALLRHFRRRVRVFIASADGASENVRVFHRRALYMTSSFSNSMRVVGKCPPPLQAPMPMGACSLISKFCFSQHLHPKFNINKASPWNFLGQEHIS